MHRNRCWNSRTIHVNQIDPQRDRRCVEISLTPETGRELALALRRLQQTSLANAPAVDELVNALDYVLVGDPHSRAQHAALERSKDVRRGPTDADFARDAKPDHRYWPSEHQTWEGFRCGWSPTASGPLCGKTKEEHGE